MWNNPDARNQGFWVFKFARLSVCNVNKYNITVHIECVLHRYAKYYRMTIVCVKHGKPVSISKPFLRTAQTMDIRNCKQRGNSCKLRFS